MKPKKPVKHVQAESKRQEDCEKNRYKMLSAEDVDDDDEDDDSQTGEEEKFQSSDFETWPALCGAQSPN